VCGKRKGDMGSSGCDRGQRSVVDIVTMHNDGVPKGEYDGIEYGGSERSLPAHYLGLVGGPTPSEQLHATALCTKELRCGLGRLKPLRVGS
jgi:hypothetical protein